MRVVFGGIFTASAPPISAMRPSATSTVRCARTAPCTTSTTLTSTMASGGFVCATASNERSGKSKKRGIRIAYPTVAALCSKQCGGHISTDELIGDRARKRRERGIRLADRRALSEEERPPICAGGSRTNQTRFGILMIFFWIAYCTSWALL